MKLNRPVIRIVSFTLFPVIVIQMASCGTLLYPERRHCDIQVDPKGRRIDPAVAVLDAACLVFFIIPGIFAFAVDFATGAIYLHKQEGQSKAIRPEQQEKAVVHMIPNKMDKATLEQIISKAAGVTISFDDKRMQAFEINRNVPTGTLFSNLDKTF